MFSHTAGEDKHILTVRDGCGSDPVDGGEEEDVSEVSKLSAGARIFRSP